LEVRWGESGKAERRKQKLESRKQKAEIVSLRSVLLLRQFDFGVRRSYGMVAAGRDRKMVTGK